MHVGLPHVGGLALEHAVKRVVGRDAVFNDHLIDQAFFALFGVFVAQQRDFLVTLGADTQEPMVGG
ncbi:hypothetical protein D3C87_1978470 [compost metagenome]